jgi:hypothetical protein
LRFIKKKKMDLGEWGRKEGNLVLIKQGGKWI